MDENILKYFKQVFDKDSKSLTHDEKNLLNAIKEKDIEVVSQFLNKKRPSNIDVSNVTEEELEKLIHLTNIDIGGDEKLDDSSNKTKGNMSATPKNIMYYRVEWDDKESDFSMKLGKLEDPLPPGVFAFTLTIDNVKSAINDIYAKEEKKRINQLKSLMKIAKVGGTSTYNDLASSHLERFKNEMILQKGGEIRLAYLKNLGISGIAIALFSLVFHSFVDFKILFGTETLSNLFLTIPGVCIGTWLTFALSNREISFDSLRQLSKTNRNPFIRMTVMTIIATVFYFMFIANFLVIGIGKDFTTSKISEYDHRGLAFLIGLFLGMAEATIGLSLTNRVQVFTSKL